MDSDAPGICYDRELAQCQGAAIGAGRVFSLYMVGTFLALAVGQLRISRIEVKGAAPFNVIVDLFAVALVMVSMTRAEPPLTVATEKLPYGQLARAAPVAVIGCSTSGLVSSAFYALVPAWMQDDGIKRETIALFMLVAVVGGLSVQAPVGRLSDATTGVSCRLRLASASPALPLPWFTYLPFGRCSCQQLHY